MGDASEKESERRTVSRRQFVAGAATAFVSAIVGGIVGSQAFPKTVTETLTKEATKTLTSTATATVPTTLTSTTTRELTKTVSTTATTSNSHRSTSFERGLTPAFTNNVFVAPPQGREMVEYLDMTLWEMAACPASNAVPMRADARHPFSKSGFVVG